MSVNNYDFPSGEPHDTYIAEVWYVRDSLNLEAEALAVLNFLSGWQPAGDVSSLPSAVDEGEATRAARLQYVSERLRLLYVGITRAEKSLVVTWNTGRRPSQKLQRAVPLLALYDYWEKRTASTGLEE
jgi:DNA helicase-2/ATP-dependent DNA helicase PcrA